MKMLSHADKVANAKRLFAYMEAVEDAEDAVEAVEEPDEDAPGETGEGEAPCL